MLARRKEHPTQERQWFGVGMTRVEDDRLVTGRGSYVDDLTPKGCLHLEFVRSPYARGDIRSLDLGAARNFPGVVAAFAASDLGKVGRAAVNPLLPDIRPIDFHLLASGRVEAVGQTLAAVVAVTPVAAREAAQLVEMDIDPLPPREGGKEDEAIAHSWKSGDVASAFDSAHAIARVTIQHARLAPTPMEPRAALAQWSHADGLLSVWLSTQTPHRARQDLANILGLAVAQIHVVAPDVGGAFGGKASLYPEDAVVAWAAKQLGQPVKWCSTRGDDLLSATHGRGAQTHGELAFDRDGHALALRARLLFPLGHWLPFSAAAPGRNACMMLPGPYRVEAVDIELSGRLNTTAAVGIYRGAGRPEAAMLMERLMDEGARLLALDPLEIRRRNALLPERFPYTTPTGKVLDSGDFPALLTKASKHGGYDALRLRQRSRREAGEICGVGLALYVEPCGEGWESATVSLAADGTIVAATGSSDQGQGRRTTFAQIVADALSVSVDRVTILHGDTAKTPTGIGALASRTTAIGGSAMLRAAQAFHQEAHIAASEILGCQETLLGMSTNGFFAKGSAKSVTWEDLARSVFGTAAATSAGRPPLSSSVIFHADGEAWSSGCCLATVSIDRDTGVPTIEQLTWVDDAGLIVNPLLANGQLVGGMAQGIGEALFERIVYDENGQLLTGSLTDYAVPRASDIPHVDIISHETWSPANALGAKGVGEAGCIGIPAAIVNAVVDALSPYGVRHLDMPLTSEKIWTAIRDGQRSPMENSQ